LLLVADLALLTSHVDLGTSVISAWSRTPAAMALAASSLQQYSRDRFSLGIGASSPPLTEGLHGIKWDRPVARLRETLTTLRALLAGARLPNPVPGAHPLRLGVVPEVPVPIVLAVNPDVKATTVSELIALAKASPGKLNFGSSGLGSTNHLAGELLKARAGIDIVHIPYRGAAPAMNDLIAGEMPMMFDNMPAVRPQVQGGKIRALAVAGAARSPLFPELPTTVEAGVANFEASSWFGLVAPAKVRPDVTKVLIEAVGKVMGEPDMVKRLADVGAEPGTLSGDAFGAFLRTEVDKWGEVVKTSGAKVD
jgi:hypothetical protein